MVEGAGAAAGGGSAFDESPLFDRLDGDDRIARIAVIRDEPIAEGQIGYLDPDATEDDLQRRWGGGRYRLQGRTEQGRMIKGAYRTVQLGGEPKFTDQIALARYNRLRAQELGQVPPPEAAPARRELTMLELLEVQEKRAEATRQQAREEFNLRQAEREAEHKREMERIRVQAEAAERERKAEAERERQRQDAAEMRRQKDQEEARARDREFFAGMLQLNKEKAAAGGGVGNLQELISLLAAARELMGGEGGDDAVTALMKNIPAILDKSQGIASHLTGGSGGSPAVTAQGDDPDKLEITGPHARKLMAACEALRARGKDPDAVLLRVFETLAAVRPRPAQPADEGDVSAPDEKQSAPAAAAASSSPRAGRRVVHLRPRPRPTKKR